MVRKKARNKSQNKDSEKTLTDEFLNSIDKDKILSNAQEIINSAVNVLEEEIAAGILAAKKIEKEVIDVDDIRHDPDDLMNRIRRDTHEAVDLFIDALTAITKHVGEISTTLDNQNGAADHSESVNGSDKENTISFIEADEPLKPGQSASMTLSVFDDQLKKPVELKIQKTDLTGPQKQSIHSRAIKIVPSTVSLKPGEEIEISVLVKVPKNAEPGKYHGLLTDANNHDFRVVIGIEVKEE
jgi:hypothetical protein